MDDHGDGMSNEWSTIESKYTHTSSSPSSSFFFSLSLFFSLSPANDALSMKTNS